MYTVEKDIRNNVKFDLNKDINDEVRSYREHNLSETSFVIKNSFAKKKLKIFAERPANHPKLNYSTKSMIGNLKNAEIDRESFKIRLSIIGNKFYNKILEKLIKQKEEELNSFDASSTFSFNGKVLNDDSSKWLACLINAFFELDAEIAGKMSIDDTLKLKLENKGKDKNKLCEEFYKYWKYKDFDYFEKFIEEIFVNASTGMNKLYSSKDKSSISSLLNNLTKSSFWKTLILGKIFEKPAIIEESIYPSINNLDDSFGFKTPEKQRYYGYDEEIDENITYDPKKYTRRVGLSLPHNFSNKSEILSSNKKEVHTVLSSAILIRPQDSFKRMPLRNFGYIDTFHSGTKRNYYIPGDNHYTLESFYGKKLWSNSLDKKRTEIKRKINMITTDLNPKQEFFSAQQLNGSRRKGLKDTFSLEHRSYASTIEQILGNNCSSPVNKLSEEKRELPSPRHPKKGRRYISISRSSGKERTGGSMFMFTNCNGKWQDEKKNKETYLENRRRMTPPKKQEGPYFDRSQIPGAFDNSLGTDNKKYFDRSHISSLFEPKIPQKYFEKGSEQSYLEKIRSNKKK